jgi:uncharacterized protein
MNIHVINKNIFLFISYCLFFQVVFSQYKIPEKPSFIPPIIDSIHLLSSVQYKQLYEKLKNYNDTTSTEILVAIIANTKGDNINYVGAQWGHKWGIGQEDKDNGVLVLLAKEDRKVAIYTGYGT